MPTNSDRANWARKAVLAFRKTHKMDSVMNENISDLMTDLGHLCDEEGLDFEYFCQKAVTGWKEEKHEEAMEPE